MENPSATNVEAIGKLTNRVYGNAYHTVATHKQCGQCQEIKSLSEFPLTYDNRAKVKIYRSMCRECKRTNDRTYRRENRDTDKLTYRKWASSDRGRELINAATRRRRAVKRNLPHVAYQAQDIYERDSGVCMLCGFFVSSDEYHIEHVVPLQVDASLLLSYGISHHPGDVPWNVSVAHPSCNYTKGNRMRQEDAANYALLQYLYKE